MDVALGYSPGGMTKKGSDRQFGKTQVTRDARKRVPQSMWRDALDPCCGA